MATVARPAPVFTDAALFLIAGPCVLEDDALNLRVGEHLARLAERVPGGIVFELARAGNEEERVAREAVRHQARTVAACGAGSCSARRRRLAPTAAATKPANKGCGRVGRDCSSGWNWQPTNQG